MHLARSAFYYIGEFVELSYVIKKAPSRKQDEVNICASLYHLLSHTNICFSLTQKLRPDLMQKRSAGNSGVIFDSSYFHQVSTLPGSLFISLRPTVSINVFLFNISRFFIYFLIIGFKKWNVKAILDWVNKVKHKNGHRIILMKFDTRST